MCIFQTKKFHLYPEQTSLHLGYQMLGETSRQWCERGNLEQKYRDEENRERNALGQVPACELAQLKAAERKSDYRA